MKWNQDDRILLMLYGEKSLPETIASMKKVRSSLEEDEKELDRMLADVIWKLQQISEKEYAGMRM